MKNVKRLVSALLSVLMLCALLSGCGDGIALDEDGYITLDSAKSLADTAVKNYVNASSSITDEYFFYSSSSGNNVPDLTSDENAIVLYYNTQGSQMLVDGEEYTADDIVVLVSSDGTEVTVIGAPDMTGSPINTGNGVTMSDIEGYWKYDTHDNYYAIIETGEWFLYDMDKTLLASGTSDYSNGILTLSGDNLVENIVITVESFDRMVDNDGDALSRYNPEN